MRTFDTDMKKNQKLQIAVATHKKYRMPALSCYFPLHVGRNGTTSPSLQGYVGDDTGINISEKNPFFCELTGLYWLWKNTDSEYLGMVHYRRYFRSLKHHRSRDPMKSILREEEALKLLEDYDMILPKKRHYVIETLYSHYSHTHYSQHLECMKNILKEKAPEYSEIFLRVLKRRSAHMYNMFIMKREVCDRYCQWLFPLLMELEKRTDLSRYSSYQARLIGRIGELLLDVWIEKNQMLYCEVPVIYMEKINWWNKGSAFLKAKFLGKKYDGSF